MDFTAILECIPTKVTATINFALMQPVNLQEVKATVFNLEGSKAAGLDGIPGSFYHKSWDTINLDMFRDVQSFFHSGRMLKKWNETSIVLILKVNSPKSILHYRSTSLTNSSYKIISKIMVNRLSMILSPLPKVLLYQAGLFRII